MLLIKSEKERSNCKEAVGFRQTPTTSLYRDHQDWAMIPPVDQGDWPNAASHYIHRVALCSPQVSTEVRVVIVVVGSHTRHGWCSRSDNGAQELQHEASIYCAARGKSEWRSALGSGKRKKERKSTWVLSVKWPNSDQASTNFPCGVGSGKVILNASSVRKV